MSELHPDHPWNTTGPRKRDTDRFKGFESAGHIFQSAAPGMQASCFLPTIRDVQVRALVITGQHPAFVASVSLRINGVECAYAGSWSDDHGVKYTGGHWLNADASFAGVKAPPKTVVLLLGSGMTLTPGVVMAAEVRLCISADSPDHGAQLRIVGNCSPRDIFFP